MTRLRRGTSPRARVTGPNYDRPRTDKTPRGQEVRSLSLVSGLSIADPLGRLTTFCEHAYAYYDVSFPPKWTSGMSHPTIRPNPHRYRARAAQRRPTAHSRDVIASGVKPSPSASAPGSQRAMQTARGASLSGSTLACRAVAMAVAGRASVWPPAPRDEVNSARDRRSGSSSVGSSRS
jgi:hypothetical protein